jgi:hypothetical protein
MPSDITFDYYVTLALWAGSLVYLLLEAWGRRPVAGLALAYWGQLALMHLLGGVIQLLPWHVNPDRIYTLRGFPMTGYALAGLLIGQVLTRPRSVRPLPPPRETVAVDRRTTSLASVCVVLGLTLYFCVGFLGRLVPGAGAVLGIGLNLVAASCCLLWWTYYRSGRQGEAWLRSAWVFLLPLVVVVVMGFIGAAVNVLMTLCAFIVVFYHVRTVSFTTMLVSSFLGLSLYSAYMSARDEIRSAVWGGMALQDRVSVTSSTLQQRWAWFDPGEQKQLDFIEGRLNQNILLGAARQQIESRTVALAEGETFLNALIALIPRILWPDKPVFGGSGRMVTRFTGISFATGTSVGIGHVMELYVNFGEAGVLIGFILIGAALSVLDERSALRLRAGDTEGFLFFFLLGQTLLVVIGNFAETTAAALGSVILCTLLTRYLFPAWVRRLRAGGRPQPA